MLAAWSVGFGSGAAVFSREGEIGVAAEGGRVSMTVLTGVGTASLGVGAVSYWLLTSRLSAWTMLV